jgi:hypothetical protein
MNFFIKQLLKQKLKGSVPEAELDMFIAIVEKNPELFKKIAEEIQAKISTGMSQQDASVQVMKAHQSELTGLMK